VTKNSFRVTQEFLGIVWEMYFAFDQLPSFQWYTKFLGRTDLLFFDKTRTTYGFLNYAVELGSSCHDIHTKFSKDWFMHSKVFMEQYTLDTHSHRQQGIFMSLLPLIQNKESWAKTSTSHYSAFLFSQILTANQLYQKEWMGNAWEHSKPVILYFSPEKRTVPYNTPSLSSLPVIVSLCLCSINILGRGRVIELRYHVRQNYFKLD
jgi:hypothetical protein